MSTIELFKNYLLSSGITSKITVKNYVSDVNKFLKWFNHKFRREFLPADFDENILSQFINEGGSLIGGKDSPNRLPNQPKLERLTSPRSMQRYMSSLRRFSTFLIEANLISVNPFSQASIINGQLATNPDPWYLKSFKDFLYVGGVSRITAKNYMVDINAFTSWLEYRGYQKGDSSNYIESINPNVISEYKNVLAEELGLSQATIDRKMSSIRKYLSFSSKNGLINEETSPFAVSGLRPEGFGPAGSEINTVEPILATQDLQQNLSDLGEEPLSLDDAEADTDYQPNIQDIATSIPIYSPFPPFRLIQRLSEPYFAFENAAAARLAGLFSIRKLSAKRPQIKTPNWYKRYHNISFTHYLHVAILIIYASVIGGILYNGFVTNATQNKTLAANVSTPSVMSFQGRLTDDNDNPITTATNVRFMIYSSSTASGSANLLWQELDNVDPDEDGVFSILLGNGSTCSNSPNGVQTTACAFPTNLFTNNTNLYLGITVENTPELTPRQQLANVPYAANANSLQGYVPITASGAPNANVILALDSSGHLVMGGSSEHKFQASGGLFTLTGTILHLKTNEGTASNIIIEPDDLGRIDVRAAFVNESIKGKISPGGVEFDDKVAILATESAVAAFIVNNNTTGGDIFAASSSGSTQFVVQNDGDLSIQAGASIDTISAGTISIGGTTATTISLGRIGQSLTLPGFTGQNGILYGEYGTGALTQATTSSSGLCLVSGASNPAWGSCNTSASSPFQQSNGAIFANNSTTDFLVGGQATTSAKFALLNMNSGTPTASVAGNFIVMPNTALGAAGGMIGIGVAEPTHTLHLWNDDAAKGATTTWTVTSDIRTKGEISTFTDGLDIINQINPVNFTYNGAAGTISGTQGIGVIAQDIQKVAPYMVGEYTTKLHPNDTNTTKILDFNPHALFFITINAIKELNSKLNNLAQEISTRSLKAGDITADRISIAGQSLEDYVTQITSEANNQWLLANGQLISPLASIDQLHTNLISPIGDDVPVRLAGNLAVTGNATISGNLAAQSASIAGELISDSIQTNEASVSGNLAVTGDATISGTLYANSIKADQIEDLDRELISAYRMMAASESSTLIASMNGQTTISNTQAIDISSIVSDFGSFRQGLMALGPASFTQATFSDSVSIGTNMIITPNSINSIGTELAIQPLRQGAIDFLAGAVRIETDGTLKVTGNAFFAQDVTIKGKLKTGRIEPDQDGLTISGPSLDVEGAASVSGGLTVNKLNLFHASNAYAISDTEVVATSSAGMDSIKPYRSELTIYNPNVTDKSLIYVSPVGTTYDTSPTLLRQNPGISFTVGISQVVNSEIKFNWIIVN